MSGHCGPAWIDPKQAAPAMIAAGGYCISLNVGNFPLLPPAGEGGPQGRMRETFDGVGYLLRCARQTPSAIARFPHPPAAPSPVNGRRGSSPEFQTDPVPAGAVSGSSLRPCGTSASSDPTRQSCRTWRDQTLGRWPQRLHCTGACVRSVAASKRRTDGPWYRPDWH